MRSVQSFRKPSHGLLHAAIAMALLGASAGHAAADPAELARALDLRLQQQFEADAIRPAPAADDAEFFRRLSVDLLGHIPTAEAAAAFIRDSSAEKREAAIDQLVASPQHAAHFAGLWRALLLPEAETDRQIRYFVPGFEAWLRERREKNRGFDVIVHELLTVRITGTDERPQLVLKDLRTANPLAFIAAREADPGKLAAAATRLFLGVRLECAQCHDHPFDKWTQEQFWNQAAFFAGIQRKGRGPFAPLLERPETRTIALMNDTTRAVPALFLDGSEPAVADGELPRTALARWITARDNPYFARAIVNRVWGQLMGHGLVEPVDDFQDSSPSRHPELLQDLATAFAASDYDLTQLYRVICRTHAYQRTSCQTDASQSEPFRFARMLVKPMSGEQFYDSLELSLRPEQELEGRSLMRSEDAARQRFLDAFGQQGDQRDPETSVLQALTLMNGPIVGEATDPDTSVLLQALEAKHGSNSAQTVEQLYLRTLSRFPTDPERTRLELVLRRDSEQNLVRNPGDILWMLLNSAEFRWNH